MTFLLLALAGGVFIVWLYYHREVAVRGRWLLAAARVLALALLLLLLWNPAVPGVSDSGPGELPWLLLDGSLSMGAAEGVPTPWEDALRKARSGEWGGILVFGDEPRAVTPDQLTALEPGAPRSRLEPALERASEAGARKVVVVSDGRIERPREARSRTRTLGLSAEFEAQSYPVVNAGIAELDLPARVDSAAEVRATVVVFAQGLEETDSLALDIREEGRLVASRRVPAPGTGRLGRTELTLSPPEGTGLRRYSAKVSVPDDVFPDDDLRPAWVEVDPEEGGVVLLSLRPDWEPRFLLPVLERVSGLGGEGFLAMGEGRFLTLGGGSDGPGVVDQTQVRRRVPRARILVIHGLGAGAPAWVEEGVASAPAAVIFPLDRPGAEIAGVRVGSARSGEWYPAGPLPASPLAGDLAGVDLSRLPPLEDLLPLEGPDGASVPLTVQRRGRGSPEAALALLEAEGGRRAVILGRGLWRWGFRQGAGRETYRRLWAGVAGWLLAGGPLASARPVEPERWVMARGEAIRWRAPALESDEVRIRVTAADESPVTDTVVSFESGRARTPPLSPGTYSYLALGDGDRALARGRFDVESYTDELLLPVADLSGEQTAEGGSPPGAEAGGYLRTHPLPYLMILVLLCAEWVGRRRKGLR